jgi:DNA-binding protein HU-beta
MTKEELVKKVAEKMETSQSSASKTVDAIFDSLKQALGKGDSFRMIGFGTFKVVERSERKGRNPRTGSEITIPAQKTVRFTPGKGLKELLNPKGEKGGKKKKKK